MSRSAALGEVKEVRLAAGPVSYRECGSGPPLVFIHGVLVNGDLWRKVVPELARDFRCITPDWPLGAHELAMSPTADLSPPGLAKLVDDFLAELGLEDVTVVANDTGGAIAQILVSEYPRHVGRLVLTPCDSFDNFFPLMFKYLHWGAFVPGLMPVTAQILRIRLLRRVPFTFSWLTKNPIDTQISDSYIDNLRSSRAVQHDARRVLKGVSSKYTQAAAQKLGKFDKPVLIAWAREDKVFPFAHAQKLAELFPQGRLEAIDNCYSFIPEDQPLELARLIKGFVRESVLVN